MARAADIKDESSDDLCIPLEGPNGKETFLRVFRVCSFLVEKIKKTKRVYE